MKKTILVLFIVSLIPVINYAQQVYSFPSSSNKIMDISVDTKTWTVNNSEGIFTISPLSSLYDKSLVCMMWASLNPTSENAIEEIATQAFSIIESKLTNVTWIEETSQFENNGISFVASDGTGYLTDGETSTKMVTSVMLLIMPDNINLIALVFTSTEDAYDIYEKKILDVILSIK